ncbi:MAG: nucleoside-diphosphate kinase [Nanoarchaeota archaeon]|nr:nucleoside-diphosphate kinase [Nanoarchaeota archaeon]MBU1104047.1 nucleoside-diphosphate kinase [Nanoarchaeota archaeon]
MEKERTLVLIKPDGVQRGLMGEIISRIERTGLKIVGMKMVLAGDEILDKHYALTDEWARELTEKSKSTAEKEGRDFPFENHMELGGMIQSRLKKSLSEGPAIAMIWEGFHAVQIVRKIVGHTEPKQSVPGTIRGDFLLDSYELADKEERAVKNLIHASSDLNEAKREVGLWFVEEEFF